MKITNIELSNTTYNNITDLFTALVSLTINDCLVIDGISAIYSDDTPAQNKIEYPDGFRFKDEDEQTLINEHVLSEIAKHAKQHDKKIIHDAVRKIMTNTNNKK